MDVKEAIRIAKDYVKDILADEQITNLGVEETEYHPENGSWTITLGFSRPWTTSWSTPRPWPQEVFETLGGVFSLKRACKVIAIAADGTVLSMKDRYKFKAPW